MKNNHIFLALGAIALLTISQNLVADFWHNTRARLTGKPNPLVGPNGEIGQQGTAGKLVDTRTNAQAKADLDEINRKSAEADRLRIQAKKEKDRKEHETAVRVQRENDERDRQEKERNRQSEATKRENQRSENQALQDWAEKFTRENLLVPGSVTRKLTKPEEKALIEKQPQDRQKAIRAHLSHIQYIIDNKV